MHLNVPLFPVPSFLLLVIRGVPNLIIAQTQVSVPFKLPTCDWLRKGWSHSHTESSLVFWLRHVVRGLTHGLYMLLMTNVFVEVV